MAKRFVDEDMVRIRGDYFDRFERATKQNRVVQILYWGDEIDLVDPAENDDPTVRDLSVTYYDYVASVVSSGDENAAKEFVHPRTNLMAGLGRHSRGGEPLLFCTELAAFFTYRGGVQPEEHRAGDDGVLADLPGGDRRGFFFAFERLRFGAIRARTDGHRLFFAPESAGDRVKEAYAYEVADDGAITSVETRIV